MHLPKQPQKTQEITPAASAVMDILGQPLPPRTQPDARQNQFKRAGQAWHRVDRSEGLKPGF